MPSSTTHEANRLYWETDESVAGIAERLELSRRALYDAVQPLPAGRDCPDCRRMMVYENRSARNSDNAICISCDVEDDATAPMPAASADMPLHIDENVLRIGGAALAGAAIGSLITMLVVRRR